MRILKTYFFLFLSIFILNSCKNEEKEKEIKFCLNFNAKKNKEQCEKCLKILDENKNTLKVNEYTNKKITYLLLLKRFNDATKFISEQEFKFNDEKEIRIKEVNLVKSNCEKNNFPQEKEKLLKYIDEKLLMTNDKNIVKFLKDERASINSDYMVDYFCAEK